MNEYLREFNELQELDSYRQQMWFGRRRELVEEYSWAVPNDEVIQRIVEFGHIIEMGAGSGYWTNLLRDAGADVEAYDIDPPDDTWTEVVQCSEDESIEYVKLSRADTLLLIWPPYDKSMAQDMLDAFDGSTVIYVGEGSGGCTAGDRFHQTLRESWEREDFIEIPSYDAVHDNCHIYTRQ